MSEILTPLDACWLHMEAADNPMMITGVLLLGGVPEIEPLNALLADRLVSRYPRFARRVTDGLAPRWEEDPNFDLRRHVHRVALPAPGGRAALEALVGALMSTPLDLRRSPWDLHVVEGAEGGAALVIRVHHCVADGISLARVLLSLADGAERPRTSPPSLSERLARARRLAERAVAQSVDALTHPSDLARTLAEQTGAALRLVALPPDPPTPLRGPLSTHKVCAWSDPVPLAAIKAIGRARGATINDVLLAALAGALRGWLLDRGAEVEQIRVFLPVNLRSLDVPIPSSLGNQFSLVVVELPVGEPTPGGRLARVHERMEALKNSHDPEVVYAMLHALGATPAAVERMFVSFLGQKASAIVTNVPGPREPLTLCGLPLNQVLVWVPQSGNVGLGVSLLSYAGAVVIGVAADGGLIPEPRALVDGVLDELDALSRAGPDGGAARS